MRISVIYASLPNRNPGMISVNKSFRSWLDWSNLRAEVMEYQLGKRYVAKDAPPAIELRGLLEEAFQADAVLYWGDWLQMYHYHQDIVKTYQDGQWADVGSPDPTETPEDTMQMVRKHLLLRGRPANDLRKTLLVGGTLALTSPADLAAREYTEPLTELMSRAALVQMRDLPSAHIARTLRGSDRDDACCGCDCALLYTPPAASGSSLESLFRSNSTAIFLGRNAEAHSRVYTSFVRELCGALGTNPRWIEWFSKRPQSQKLIPRALRKARRGLVRPSTSRARHPEGQAGPALDDLLEEIATCRFTITDTYHLAVNSWNVGVPAVCIADTTDSRPWNLNSGNRHAWRDKRYEFYSMIEALPYFVHASELSRKSSRLSRLEQLSYVLLDDSDARRIASSRIDTLRDGTRLRILHAVKSLLLS